MTLHFKCWYTHVNISPNLLLCSLVAKVNAKQLYVKKTLNAPSPLLVATQCRVCFIDAVHTYSRVDYVNTHMFRWPAPAAIRVLWWKMCSCPIWRQTSQSSDTLKSPRQVCVSFSVCVCVYAYCYDCANIVVTYSEVRCCLVDRAVLFTWKEVSSESVRGHHLRHLYEGTVINAHAFYLALALTARFGLTIPSSTDVLKQTSCKGRGTPDMWFGDYIRACSCDIRFTSSVDSFSRLVERFTLSKTKLLNNLFPFFQVKITLLSGLTVWTQDATQ